MAYIISRNNRFYVVAYDGLDPAQVVSVDAGIPPATRWQTPKEVVPGSVEVWW